MPAGQTEPGDRRANAKSGAGLATSAAPQQVESPPGFNPAPGKKKRSHKNKLMSAFNKAACDKAACEDCVPAKAPVAEGSTQTELSLPHTHRDVIWTASCLNPIVQIDLSSEASSEDDLQEEILEPPKAKFQ